MPKNGKEWSQLIACLLICHAAGLIGSVFTAFSIPLWYNTLTLPYFAPPNWVFGPVWTLLYTLMGIALYMAWKDRGGSIDHGRARKRGLIFFTIQLILNTLWSILFFGMQSPLYGLVGIVLLLASIAVTIYYFEKVNLRAAYLLVPYILWVAFASVLNYAIFILN